MEHEHAQTWQTQYNIRSPSSKLLQIRGKRYQERDPRKHTKNIPNLINQNPKTIFHIYLKTTTPGLQTAPSRGPKQCAGQDQHVPATDQVRHSCTCSSRNLFWHKKQSHAFSSGPGTRASCADIQENFKRSSRNTG